jgi:glycosyltransferase involved in cell wall biosynthesis
MEVGILGIKRIPASAGADRTVELLLDNLPPRHHYTVYVAHDGRASTPSSRARYVEIRALSGKRARATTYFLLSSLHAVVKGRYEVLHVHNSEFGAFCLLLRLRRGTRIVGTFHGDPYRREKWGPVAKLLMRISEWCFVRACHILTSVTPVKTVPGREVNYIPNGVAAWHSEPTRRQRALAKLGVRPGEFVTFASGRLDRTKGLHHLIHAYAAIRDPRPLLAVADFSHDPEYSKEIENSARGDLRVVLHKWLLPRDELLEAVAASAVFVFPSETEGMSMMLLEAISCGALVVCSDIPENVAVVGESYPLLFRSSDVGALRETLARALTLTDDAGFVQELRAGTGARFRWDAIAGEYAALYERCQ